MDFVDILLKRLDCENELKRPIHVLISFSKPETGKALGILANELVKLRTEKPTITALHLISNEEEAAIEDITLYKTMLFSDIIAESERNKVTIRTFVKTSENFVEDILQTSQEHGCNLVLLGMGNKVINPQLWDKYSKLKREPENSESFIMEQFEPNQANYLLTVSSFLSRNTAASGIFINNNFKDARNIFVPILDKEDVHIFTYLYQMAVKENVFVMVWDAIGITETDAKLQKLYQYITKKTDNRVKKWDNDIKISTDFISQQDLIIIGIEAWEKLISTPLSWIPSLPSTLIIKDKTTQ